MRIVPMNAVPLFNFGLSHEVLWVFNTRGSVRRILTTRSTSPLQELRDSTCSYGEAVQVTFYELFSSAQVISDMIIQKLASKSQFASLIAKEMMYA